MNKKEQILDFVDKLPFPMMAAEILLLKSSLCIDMVIKIMEESGKMASEAVLVFLAAIRFQAKDSGEVENLFTYRYIEDNAEQISQTAIQRKVQSNLPSRAMPLLEVLAENLDNPNVSVIELGASYGLVGLGLLEPEKIISGKERYFSQNQQMPRSYIPIRRYLGIELAPPEKEWLLACEWHPVLRERLNRFIDDNPRDDRSFLYRGNAFEFPEQDIVQEFVGKKNTQNPGKSSEIVILTSFILYQYDRENQRILENKILEFIERFGGHWIKQLVNVEDSTFYIEWDNERIIQLNDDTCTNWRWI